MNVPSSSSVSNIHSLQDPYHVPENLKPDTTNLGVPSRSPTISNRSQEIQQITLDRPSGSGIGLSIVCCQGLGDQSLGIYVKNVVHGSPAFIVNRELFED